MDLLIRKLKNDEEERAWKGAAREHTSPRRRRRRRSGSAGKKGLEGEEMIREEGAQGTRSNFCAGGGDCEDPGRAETSRGSEAEEIIPEVGNRN